MSQWDTVRPRQYKPCLYKWDGVEPKRDDDLDASIALWRAVLERALLDALQQIDPMRPAEGIIIKRAAVAWIVSFNEDFQRVCTFAGFNPGYVRSRYLELDATADFLPRGDQRY